MRAQPGRRPARLRWTLAVLLLIPVVELVVIVQVADWIGAWSLLLLLAAAVAGVLILVRGGPATFRRVREAARSGRVPSGELADAFLTVLGGALLLVPGFVTDVLALLCLVPPFRWVAKAALRAGLARLVSRTALRMHVAGGGTVVPGAVVPPGRQDGFAPGQAGREPGGRPVIEGQVLPGEHEDDGRPRPGG